MFSSTRYHIIFTVAAAVCVAASLVSAQMNPGYYGAPGGYYGAPGGYYGAPGGYYGNMQPGYLRNSFYNGYYNNYGQLVTQAFKTRCLPALKYQLSRYMPQNFCYGDLYKFYLAGNQSLPQWYTLMTTAMTNACKQTCKNDAWSLTNVFTSLPDCQPPTHPAVAYGNNAYFQYTLNNVGLALNNVTFNIGCLSSNSYGGPSCFLSLLKMASQNNLLLGVPAITATPLDLIGSFNLDAYMKAPAINVCDPCSFLALQLALEATDAMQELFSYDVTFINQRSAVIRGAQYHLTKCASVADNEAKRLIRNTLANL